VHGLSIDSDLDIQVLEKMEKREKYLHNKIETTDSELVLREVCKEVKPESRIFNTAMRKLLMSK
jgi:hypothetical protein